MLCVFRSIQTYSRTGTFVVIVQLHQVGIDDLEFTHCIRNVLLICESYVDISEAAAEAVSGRFAERTAKIRLVTLRCLRQRAALPTMGGERPANKSQVEISKY